MIKVFNSAYTGSIEAPKWLPMDEVKEEIVDFVDINKNRLRELSLRTVLKVADLAKAFPDTWESYAENTVMRRA